MNLDKIGSIVAMNFSFSSYPDARNPLILFGKNHMMGAAKVDNVSVQKKTTHGLLKFRYLTCCKVK
jgi:hypothetical protein